MPHWTNLEYRRLIEVHRIDCPPQTELAAMFPRHSIGAVLRVANKLGIHRKQYSVHWRRIAREHLKKRNLECEAKSCRRNAGSYGSRPI